MNILLFGASGQVGFELQRSLASIGNVISPGFCNVPRIDLGDAKAIENCIKNIAPQIVVNAAAYTAVDKAETEQAQTMLINAVAPGVIGRAAALVGAAVVHYSTDYVFDGHGSRAWLESDQSSPLNHYGSSKRAGEEALAAANAQNLIFRTSWVYSLYGRNFPKTMLRLAEQKDMIDIVNDQFGAPTPAALLADLTAHALLQITHKKNLWGLYHVAAGGETNWHDFAKVLLSRAFELNLISRIPKINSVTSSHYVTAAKRPLNSRLNTEKFRSTFGLHLPDWQTGAEYFLAQLSLGNRSLCGP